MENTVTHACLVHPHPLECEAVAEWLRKKSYVELVGKCASLEQFTRLSYLRDIDMALVFAHDTAQVAEQILKIRKQNSRIRFLLLAPGYSAESIGEVIRSGVSGYIVPEAELDEWERSVRAVAEGKVYYGQEIMVKLAAITPEYAGSDPGRNRKEHLSKREVEILKLVASEYSTNRIANELCISDKTVETHRRNLFQKLGVKNAVGLTKAAVRMGVV